MAKKPKIPVVAKPLLRARRAPHGTGERTTAENQKHHSSTRANGNGNGHVLNLPAVVDQPKRRFSSDIYERCRLAAHNLLPHDDLVDLVATLVRCQVGRYTI